MKSAFIVLNPKVGNCDVDAVRRAVERCLGGDGWTHRVYEMDGQERVGRPIRAALAQGFDVFVAIGDDGTVSAVADGLVRSGVPLGIVPAGTGNALAQDLGIPADLEASLELVVGQHDVKSIDAMRVGDRFAVRNVGIGISALMMRDTGHSAKQWLGLTAYVKTGLSKLLGFQPYQFTVVVDGQRSEWRASEVMVVNSGAIGDPYLHWGPQVRLNDRQLDVCIMRAKSVIDYLIGKSDRPRTISALAGSSE
jgi:diacylglycerol kinase (ATP)